MLPNMIEIFDVYGEDETQKPEKKVGETNKKEEIYHPNIIDLTYNFYMPWRIPHASTIRNDGAFS